MNQLPFALGVGVGFAAAILFYAVLRFFAPWTRALCSGAHVSILRIVGMRLRGNPPAFLIDAHRALVHSGLRVTLNDVESCYIARKHAIRPGSMDDFMASVRKWMEEKGVK